MEMALPRTSHRPQAISNCLRIKAMCMLTTHLTSDYFRLAAGQGQMMAQLLSGTISIVSGGSGINRSLGAHYIKSAVDQGDSDREAIYVLLLITGTGVAIDTRLAAHYSKLSADQRNYVCSVPVWLPSGHRRWNSYKLLGDQGSAYGQLAYSTTLI
jgi:hypothetical protein